MKPVAPPPHRVDSIRAGGVARAFELRFRVHHEFERGRFTGSLRPSALSSTRTHRLGKRSVRNMVPADHLAISGSFAFGILTRDSGGCLCAAEPPEDARLDRHRRHERALRAQRWRALPVRSTSRGLDRTRRTHGRPSRAPRRWRGDGALLSTNAAPCEGRGRRDAPRALLRLRGFGGDPARMPPVTSPAGVAGADWCERGSDRRQNRPPGQWRQGDC